MNNGKWSFIEPSSAESAENSELYYFVQKIEGSTASLAHGLHASFALPW